MNSIWNQKDLDEEKVKQIVEKFKINEFLAKLLVVRNIELDEVELFLKPTLKDIQDPYEIKDMDKFVERILEAIKNKDKICIYGDYDVDGITSITVMYKYLKDLGLEVDYYMPNRLTEGYGLSNEGILEIKERKKSDLIISVDCGITADKEAIYAKELGIDLIITDHHNCPDILPEAIAVINPKRKDDTSNFKYHAGVGVAFKCIMAISKKLNLSEDSYLKFLDIVCLGTIADIVALTDENRVLVKYGLEKMKVTKNIGLSSLIEICNMTDLDTSFVSYSLAPRINACGRMGRANIAVDMMLSGLRAQASIMADRLDTLNRERQTIEKNILEEIKEIVDNSTEEKSSIVLYNENWHNGVLGIVAARLVALYNKPVVLLTMENGVIRGSSRCPLKFLLYTSLEKCKDLLVRFGGHELAAGLTIEKDKIEEFSNRFDDICKENKQELKDKVLDIDLELTSKDLTSDTVKAINMLKPFGHSNAEPLFMFRNFKINTISTISENKHLKLTLKSDNVLINTIAFSAGERRDEFVIGDEVDVIGNLAINKYNGTKTLQIIIKDFKKSN